MEDYYMDKLPYQGTMKKTMLQKFMHFLAVFDIVIL